MKFFMKNTIFIFSIMCIFLSLFITSAYCSNEKELANNESKIVGDVNGDGKMDSIDFAQMRRTLLGLIDGFSVSNGVWASDLDGNGVFNSIDFATMRQFLLGIIELPDEIVDSPTPVVSAYFGLSGRRFRNYPDTKPEHPDTLSVDLIL